MITGLLKKLGKMWDEATAPPKPLKSEIDKTFDALYGDDATFKKFVDTLKTPQEAQRIVHLLDSSILANNQLLHAVGDAHDDMRGSIEDIVDDIGYGSDKIETRMLARLESHADKTERPVHDKIRMFTQRKTLIEDRFGLPSTAAVPKNQLN